MTVGRAAVAHGDGLPEAVARAWLTASSERLQATLRTAVPAPLARWADELENTDGDTPLVGTGRRAGRYEALLWGAARHSDPFVITALLCAAPATDAEALGRALATGAAVAATVPVPGGPARTDPVVLGCAVVAALVGGDPRPDVDALLDVAAGLLPITATAARPDADRVRLMRAGHPAAAGWLATRCLRAGVTGMPDAVDRTVAVVTGTASARALA